MIAIHITIHIYNKSFQRYTYCGHTCTLGIVSTTLYTYIGLATVRRSACLSISDLCSSMFSWKPQSYHLYLLCFNNQTKNNNKGTYRLLDSLVVEWLRVRDVPGSIPSQGPRHTKDVIKMVPVVPLFSTQHWKGKYCLFLKN